MYQALGNYFQIPIDSGKGISYPFELYSFCKNYNLPLSETYNCLKILELQGLIEMSDAIALSSRIIFCTSAESLYNFQVMHVRYDLPIKVILRLYQGVFDEYVNIQEEEIALRCTITKNEIIEILQKLQSLNILKYIAASDKPQLTYTEARLDKNNFNIDRQNLSDRKTRFIERARSMLNYAETRNRCRSQMLVAYFGEINTERCGICDYCLERNKQDISDLDLDDISHRIKTVLKSKPISLQELVLHLRPSSEEKSIKVIQWMLENGNILYLSGEELAWHED